MIAVLQKTFLLLETFAGLGDPQPLAHLARATGLPKPTVYRLVQSLMDLGYLVQDPRTGHYLRTPVIERLGRHGPHGYLRHRARTAMEALHGRFDETVSLAALVDTEAHYLLVLETSRSLRCVPPAGGKRPYYATALGCAIAAWLPPEEQTALLQRTRLRPLTPRTVSSKQRLRQLLEQTRRRGWSFQDQECEAGVCGLAAPLLEHGRVIGAIGFAVPRIRLNHPTRRAMVDALLGLRL